MSGRLRSSFMGKLTVSCLLIQSLFGRSFVSLGIDEGFLLQDGVGYSGSVG